MLNIQLIENCGSVVGYEKLLDVVDYHFVHTYDKNESEMQKTTIWSVSRPDLWSQLNTGINVTNNRFIDSFEVLEN